MAEARAVRFRPRLTRLRFLAALLVIATSVLAVVVAVRSTAVELPGAAPPAVSVAEPIGEVGPIGPGPFGRGPLVENVNGAPVTFDSAVGSTITVPILMYHFVRVNPVPKDRIGFALSVTPADFEAQLAFLKAHQVHSLSPDEFWQAVSTGHQPHGPVVLMTFDDGFADFATTAAPLLRKYGFTALDYVVSGLVGSPNYMTAEQLVLVERLGMHIGAHTVHHVPLASVAPSTWPAEINASKAQLEAILHHPILDFAYPFGSVSPAVEAAVKAAGFRTAVTTHFGSVLAVADPFSLHRVRVNGGETMPYFIWSVGLGPAPAPALPPNCPRRQHC